MGDRANVYVHHGADPGVYLYTHWTGTQLPEMVRTALKRAPERWGDDQYLNRIIFFEIDGRDTAGAAGLGISAQWSGDVHRIVDVDTAAQTVTLRVEGEENTAVPMRDYVAAGVASWPNR